jgi:hypothetical protein
MSKTSTDFTSEKARLLSLLQSHYEALIAAQESLNDLPDLIRKAQEREARDEMARSYLAGEHTREARIRVTPERVRIEDIHNGLMERKRAATAVIDECLRTFSAFSPMHGRARKSSAAIQRLRTARTYNVDRLEAKVVIEDVAAVITLLESMGSGLKDSAVHERGQSRADLKQKRKSHAQQEIDEALVAIQGANPRSQKDIIKSLDHRKIPLPPGTTWGHLGSWDKAVKEHYQLVTSWLSTRRKKLRLPPLPRSKTKTV